MAWTQAEIDALKSAIASGTRSVTFTSNGVTRSRTYASTAEMTQALAMMERSVNGGTPYRIGRTRKGF